MKGFVSVKGSWGMGGGLLGVASFSLSWLSVSIPVAMFPLPRFARSFDVPSGAARSSLWTVWAAVWTCFYGAAAALQLICAGSPVSFEMDLVSNVGMRGQDVC